MGGGLVLVILYAVTEHVIFTFSIVFVIQHVCLVWRVVNSGRVLGTCSIMGYYLEDYRSRMGTWAARTV
jgi:hypothetical protein